jgi:hypothetical protein
MGSAPRANRRREIVDCAPVLDSRNNGDDRSMGEAIARRAIAAVALLELLVYAMESKRKASIASNTNVALLFLLLVVAMRERRRQLIGTAVILVRPTTAMTVREKKVGACRTKRTERPSPSRRSPPPRTPTSRSTGLLPSGVSLTLQNAVRQRQEIRRWSQQRRRCRRRRWSWRWRKTTKTRRQNILCCWRRRRRQKAGSINRSSIASSSFRRPRRGRRQRRLRRVRRGRGKHSG